MGNLRVMTFTLFHLRALRVGWSQSKPNLESLLELVGSRLSSDMSKRQISYRFFAKAKIYLIYYCKQKYRLMIGKLVIEENIHYDPIQV